jgi:DNA-directed RNA polymerase specialized sigma24 family protein
MLARPHNALRWSHLEQFFHNGRGEARDRLQDLVRARAGELDAPDRSLVEAVVMGGQRVSELAPLAGCSARVLRRRLKGALARLSSPEFGYVLRHRCEWPHTRRRVAEACVLRGLSQRAAAGELRISLYTVRYHQGAVLAMARCGHTAA